MSSVNDVDKYIADSPFEYRDILKHIRSLIKEIAPEATESIAYGMPAYKINGKPLVYFALFSRHVGLYATPQAHEKFATELSKYKQGKGSVQFPLNQPMPYDLIEKIVQYKLNSIIS